MNRAPSSRQGFILLEVLMTLLILAVSFAVFMGAMAQVLRVSSRASHTMEAVSQYEALLFEVESGVRSDLAGYGGRGDLKEEYHYLITAEEQGDFSSYLKSRLFLKEGKELLDLELMVLKAPVQ